MCVVFLDADLQRSHLLCSPLCWTLETGRDKSEPLTFAQGLRLVMCHGPYVKLVIGFLFTSLAFMVTLHLICAFFFFFFREFSEVALKGFFYFIYYSNLVYSCFCLLQLLEGNFALFITYALGHRKDFQNILLVIMVSVCIFTMSALLVKTLIRVDLVYINTMSADVKLAACCKLFRGYFSF